MKKKAKSGPGTGVTNGASSMSEPVKVTKVEKEEKPVKMSAKERMAAMAKKGTAPPPAAKKGKVKPVLALDGANAEAVDRLCAFANVAEVANSHAENFKGLIRAFLVETMLKQWADSGVKTDNPKVATKASSFTFVTVDKSQSVKIPANSDGSFKNFREWAEENKIPGDLVEKLLKAEEVTEKEVQVITSPDKIKEKNPELAEKLRSVLLSAVEDGTFTPDEFNELVTNMWEIKFKPGFLGRAPAYAKCLTVEESYQRLSRLLVGTKLLQTQIKNCDTTDEMYAGALAVVSAKEHAGADIDKDKVVEYETKDKGYKMVVTGRNVAVSQRDGDGYKEIGMKKCNDHKHANNLAKKMVNESTYLDEVVGEM